MDMKMGRYLWWYCDSLGWLLLLLAALIREVSSNDHAHDCVPNTAFIQWDNVTTVSRTTATLQVVSNPILNKKTSPIASKLFQTLHELQADLVRYVPWFPYPQMAVAELEPPNATTRKTSWKFSDEMQQQFLDTFHAVTKPIVNDTTLSSMSTKMKRVIINFSTQPTWMFNTMDWSYNQDPNHADWKYVKGRWTNTTTELVGDYYGRLASWIVNGHFKDEFGNFIQGGPALGDALTYWEIFNEIEAEHELSWQQYNLLYDNVVRTIRQTADPHHKINFLGMALAGHREWDYWEGFLAPENHAADVRDAVANGMASFHWYGHLSSRTNVSTYTEPFVQLRDFLEEVHQIIEIRNRLSPTTGLAVNEAGVIPPDDNKMNADPLPPIYYNMAAALYTMLVSELTLLGVDLVGSSQFCGCPAIPLWNIPDRQYPGVSMTNWTTGNGNPRYWALKLYLQYFGPKDQIVFSSVSGQNNVYVQGRRTKTGRMTAIMVNPTNQCQSLTLSQLVEAHVSIVDETTHDQHWKEFVSNSDTLTMRPFAVVVVDITKNESIA